MFWKDHSAVCTVQNITLILLVTHPNFLDCQIQSGPYKSATNNLETFVPLPFIP